MNAHLDFPAKVRMALSKKGIQVMSSVAIPIDENDRFFGAVAYNLNDNGTHKVCRYFDVIKLGEQP